MYFLLALFRILTLANKHIGNLQSKWIDLNIVKYYYANSLPNNTIFNWSKLKAFADDKEKKKKKKLKFALGRVENIVGKGENAGYKHFLLFLQCFQKASFSGLLKVGTVW